MPASSSSVARDPFIGHVIDGRYRIVERLGDGGVGTVYRGEHVQIRKAVAIKVLHGQLARTDEFRKRFEREARAASKLSHPGCVSVNDFGWIATVSPEDEHAAALIGTSYLVMEMVQGETLASHLAARKRIDMTETVVVTRAVLSALRHAHGLGLVHRDIKPSNIMLSTGTATGVMVKILDFGLAKLVSGELEPGDSVTRDGLVYGTPEYMSPEQATGAVVDARSDLYSVGVMLFEMACGQLPFPRESPMQIMRAHIAAPPPAPRTLAPSLSPELEALILRALEKDVGARVASAEEFQRLLAACPEVGEGQSKPTVRVRRGGGFKRFLVATFGLGLVVGGGVLWAWLATRHDPPAPTPRARAVEMEPPAPPPSAALDKAPLPSGATAHAFSLVKRGHSDEAILVARGAIAKNPHDGMAHAALAAAYQSKMWCSDAVEELEKAVRDAPALRSDVETAERAIACLTPRSRARATRFLVDEMGQSAVPALRSAAASDPDPEIRRAAEKALVKLGAAR